MSQPKRSDEELLDIIQENIDNDDRIQTDSIDIECVKGRPVLRGRVATNKELQAIDEILNEVLEIGDYENNIWVDDSLAFDVTDEDGASSSDGEGSMENDSPFGDDDE